MAIAGAQRIQPDPHGNLTLSTANGELRVRRPLIYQVRDGKREYLSGSFRLDDSSSTVGFHVDEYDRSLPLTIDPQLVYSTYLGGSVSESGRAVGIDAQGNIYVSGITNSTDFPTQNAYQPTKTGNSFDNYVTKLTPDGSALIFSTYFGGSGIFDDVYAMHVDAEGNAYVAGSTNSNNLPIVNAVQSVYGGGTDGFVAKFSPDGSALLYSTYLGGSLADQALDIAVNEVGVLYVTGSTVSQNFPTKDPIQSAHLGGFFDAFVAAIDPSGSLLLYSTYLGGAGSDEARGIAIDTAGNAYVTGDTRSAGFPTVNPLQAIKSGDADVFVTKFSADGQAILYSTFLGGSGTDESFGLKLIALDTQENIHIAGNVFSDDFPVMHPIQSGPSGESDAFAAKIKADGSALIYSTYLGGTAYDDALAITVDAWGNAHVTGRTLSNNFPLLNPLQSNHGGSGDVFVVEFDPAGQLLYSTYIGGSLEDRGNDIVLDPNGDPYITGQVWSTNWPKVNPYQPVLKGSQDGFVLKLTEAHNPGIVADATWIEKTTLTWTVADRADSYNVYRGDSSDLAKLLDAETDSCLVLQTPSLDSGPVLTEDPVEGSFHWYLVRAENEIGLGLPGAATAKARIHDPSGACP
jgi:hypothetical protein